MGYSLVSRFRGTFLGAFLGRSLAANGDDDFAKPAILGMESLITLGKLDVKEWSKHQTPKTPESQIIFTTLPVVLFYHENPIKLRQNLQEVLTIWDDDPVLKDVILALGWAIALAVKEKLDPLTLIPQTITFLGETSTPLTQKLLQVQTFLEQGVRLERVREELSRQETLINATTLAFYCFLSSLEDYRLAVLRAIDNNTPICSQTAGVITGALSGAYNSTVGIPSPWQILSLPINSPPGGLSNISQLLELSNVFVGAWSGVYNPTIDHRGLDTIKIKSN
ncbi:ADP-ribosylglycohydrolase family protein [Cronbergia sp. UHCC 0137]|uniref:ADP-ribosylglycohydrolase family protein n=1 Tax=Cronbergia sp. UHCC 0137 TaxID=3110239 RepID=UPI002B1F7314|nr:ADP-ribosylglycohydrolase family protein [Cronbergia sp. UHCC 0137]MEA5616928.1 ADP-ribosylglycohydrolase family protein [Cronbergia sp. UHCC 0137]